jgi:hypothetical protein
MCKLTLTDYFLSFKRKQRFTLFLFVRVMIAWSLYVGIFSLILAKKTVSDVLSSAKWQSPARGPVSQNF